jgi:nucleotidyltransferase AbiEii toxin of type IV toxin-antitoxin system
LANSKLTTLQKDFLNAFFGREDRFFLTGGAALAGFHLGHRETHNRVDPPEEILANKLCTLLERAEIRDLVDVRALEMAGCRVENALPFAALKDTGLTPAQLGWVLNQIELGDDLVPPGDVSTEELRLYLADLIARLAHIAFPE